MAAGRIDLTVLGDAIAAVAEHRNQALISIAEATARLEPGTRWTRWANKQGLTVDSFDTTLSRIAAVIDPLVGHR